MKALSVRSELQQPIRGVTKTLDTDDCGERHAIVLTNALRQAVLFEDPRKHRLGISRDRGI